MDTRRSFLRRSAALAAFACISDWIRASSKSDRLGKVLPMRRITRDGEKTTAFGVGGWHVGMEQDPKRAQALLERSVELGVRFFDNARVYGDGRSEEYYGQYLSPKYRESIWLMTKSYSHSKEKAERDLDESLRALNTDYIDLWQIHSIHTPEDVDKRFDGGVVDAFLEAKSKGKVRYIGFTGHDNPVTHSYFLEALESRGLAFDVSQMPLNVCDANYESFQNGVLPKLRESDYGVLAMKTFAGGSIMGRRFETTPKEIRDEDIPNVVELTGLSLEQLHHYVYSLPISTLVSGCKTIGELEQNVSNLIGLERLSASDIERYEQLAKPYSGYNVENYKRLLDQD